MIGGYGRQGWTSLHILYFQTRRPTSWYTLMSHITKTSGRCRLDIDPTWKCHRHLLQSRCYLGMVPLSMRWFQLQDGIKPLSIHSWWRHQTEIFSALLALCAGNSPVTGEFHRQKPVTRSLVFFFDLRLTKRLSKQSAGDFRSNRAHYDVILMMHARLTLWEIKCVGKYIRNDVLSATYILMIYVWDIR